MKLPYITFLDDYYLCRRLAIFVIFTAKTLSYMKVDIQAPWEVNQHLKHTIFEKVEKLKAYFDAIIRADVFLKLKEHSSSVEDKIVEIRLSVRGPYLFAEGCADTYEKAVAVAVEKIRKQLIKKKEKLKRHK